MWISFYLFWRARMDCIFHQPTWVCPVLWTYYFVSFFSSWVKVSAFSDLLDLGNSWKSFFFFCPRPKSQFRMKETLQSPWVMTCIFRVIWFLITSLSFAPLLTHPCLVQTSVCRSVSVSNVAYRGRQRLCQRCWPADRFQKLFGSLFFWSRLSLFNVHSDQPLLITPLYRHTTIRDLVQTSDQGLSGELWASQPVRRHNQKETSGRIIQRPQLFFLLKDQSSGEYKTVVHPEDGVTPALPDQWLPLCVTLVSANDNHRRARLLRDGENLNVGGSIKSFWRSTARLLSVSLPFFNYLKKNHRSHSRNWVIEFTKNSTWHENREHLYQNKQECLVPPHPPVPLPLCL